MEAMEYMNHEAKEKALFKDLPFFARNCLSIVTKSNGVQQLRFNKMQMLFHNFIEKHRKNGIYKFTVVKARQLGISTYTEARFFHKTVYGMGKNSYILANDLQTSGSIFDMVKTFYQNLPLSYDYKPHLQLSNQKILKFQENNSYFKIGTANSSEIGRGIKINYFHGSEVAFWREADELLKSIFQTVPKTYESEIILESTANGIGNYFHEICLSGLSPKSEFKTFFLPWHLNEEYQKPIENINEFILTDEEKELKIIHSLTDEQINWRRSVIQNEFLGRTDSFKQEYPITIQEAFVNSSIGLIPPKYIQNARYNRRILKYKYDLNSSIPIIAGLDPARNRDRTAVAIRRGRCLIKMQAYRNTDTDCLVNITRDLIDKEKVDIVFIDFAYGYSIWDTLKKTGYAKNIIMVVFKESPEEYFKSIYTNKRTEIHGKMRDWFMQDGGVEMPDNDQLEIEIASIPDFKRNSNGQYFMVSKDEIKKVLGGKSPDLTDAIALTFSYDVKNNVKKENKNNLLTSEANYDKLRRKTIDQKRIV
jgi:hypothetical protein